MLVLQHLYFDTFRTINLGVNVFNFSITLYDTMFLVFSLVQNGSASLRKVITVMGDSIITVELKHTPIQRRNR